VLRVQYDYNETAMITR